MESEDIIDEITEDIIENKVEESETITKEEMFSDYVTDVESKIENPKDDDIEDIEIEW